MQKDLKIGLILGLAVVSIAGLWLATRPSLTPQARALDTTTGSAGTKPREEKLRTTDENVRPPSDRPNSERASVVHRPSSIIPRPSKESDSLATPAMYVQPKIIKPQRFHIVQEGETLSEISYAYYGSATKWQKIFEANRSTVKNANVVRAGTKLIIPD
jgi:nucleoid-associated protein YgaU